MPPRAIDLEGLRDARAADGAAGPAGTPDAEQEWLRAQVLLGVEQLRRGDYVALDDSDLDDALDALVADPTV